MFTNRMYEPSAPPFCGNPQPYYYEANPPPEPNDKTASQPHPPHCGAGVGAALWWCGLGLLGALLLEQAVDVWGLRSADPNSNGGSQLIHRP